MFRKLRSLTLEDALRANIRHLTFAIWLMIPAVPAAVYVCVTTRNDYEYLGIVLAVLGYSIIQRERIRKRLAKLDPLQAAGKDDG